MGWKKECYEVVGLQHDLSGMLVVASGWSPPVPVYQALSLAVCVCGHVLEAHTAAAHHSDVGSHQISHNPILWMGGMWHRGVKLFAQDPTSCYWI